MTDTVRKFSYVLILQALLFVSIDAQPVDGERTPAPDTTPAIPVVAPVEPGVDWSNLFKSSLAFLTLEEGFRYVTEAGARHEHDSFFHGWGSSIDGLHGWADGDPFLVNYVGHPMQGAVSGFLWIQNDRKFRNVEFGRDRLYWKSRLRAGAFAWAYSVAEELGPLSEATIGATQSKYPQQGLVDHVITPAVGLGWIVAEDAIDKYIVKRLETKISNPYVQLVVRAGLNPSRSLANLLGGHPFWDRLGRDDVWPAGSKYYFIKPKKRGPAVAFSKPAANTEYPAIAPLEFSTMTLIEQDSASAGPCIGGGADLAFRWAAKWQVVTEVAGCKLLGLRENRSGDSLQYMVGPRWTPNPGGRWSPYAQVLVGGRRLTMEDVDLKAKATIEANLAKTGAVIGDTEHYLYSSDYESNGVAVKVGGGMDLKLNSALAVRLLGVDYMYSGTRNIDGGRPGQGIQFTGGMVLRMGTW